MTTRAQTRPVPLARVVALEDRDRAIETRLDGVDGRLKNIETGLGDITALLTKGRNVKWFVDGLFKYFGYIAAIGAAGVGILRYFGH